MRLSCFSSTCFIFVFFFPLKIQNEGYNLHVGAKDALLNALIVAAKRFTSGPPQVSGGSFKCDYN